MFHVPLFSFERVYALIALQNVFSITFFILAFRIIHKLFISRDEMIRALLFHYYNKWAII